MTVEIESDRDRENREQIMKGSEKTDQEMVEEEGGWKLEDKDEYTSYGTS